MTADELMALADKYANALADRYEYVMHGIGDAPTTNPDACAAALRSALEQVVADSGRLDWVLRHVSGAEWRRLCVLYGGNCDRAALDAAIYIARKASNANT